MTSTNFEYQIISFEIELDQADIAHGILHQLNCHGSEEVEELGDFIKIKAYFDYENSEEFLKHELQNHLPTIQNFETHHIKLNSQEFKPAPFDPIPLTKDYWILPPEDMREDIIMPQTGENLVIRPGMAFGTGRHETTQLAAKLLSQTKPTSSVLDIGTGSGVLAILSCKLGFKNVNTIEIDEMAHSNALENFELNQCPSFPLYSNINELNQKFDLIIANIVTPTLIHLYPYIIKLLNKSGKVILSGILEDELENLLNIYSTFTVVDKIQKNEWIGIKLKQK